MSLKKSSKSSHVSITNNKSKSNNQHEKENFISKKDKYLESVLDADYFSYETEIKDDTANNILNISKQSNNYTKKEKVDYYQKNTGLSLNALTEKINIEVDNNFSRQYFYSSFWDNFSNILGFSLTLLTLLTTGQNVTNNLFSENTNIALGITSIVISTCITFFRPVQNFNTSIESMKTWQKLGNDFEEIVLIDIVDDETKHIYLHKLFIKVNEQKRNTKNNFFLNFLYPIVRKFCLKSANFNIKQDISKKITAKNDKLQNSENNV